MYVNYKAFTLGFKTASLKKLKTQSQLENKSICKLVREIINDYFLSMEIKKP